MNERLYQILYCSRNNIRGTEEQVREQIEAILAASRRNNARDGVTGALFFNTVFFAQALEGSFAAVQKVFERLQLDPRHSDLVVLLSGYTTERDFAGWSMAFADTGPAAPLPFEAVEPRQSPVHSEKGEALAAFLRQLVTKQEGWALPAQPSRAASGRQVVIQPSPGA